MFEGLKKLFKKEEIKDKPILVCIHGFGSRKTDEFNFLVDYFKNDFEFVLPELFDQTDEEDTDPETWVLRAENFVKENPDKEVYLLGYSMGGVIASYMASRYENIKALVLVEPAFDYLSFTTAKETAMKALRKRKTSSEYVPIPGKWNQTFIRLVQAYRKHVADIKCPTLFIHCVDDELIPYSASIHGYNKMKSNLKRLFILGDGQHRVLDDDNNRVLVFKMIESFFSNPLAFLCKEQ